MNNLQLFDFNGINITTFTINDEVWFLGIEVAEILGYVKPHNAVYTKVDSQDTKTLSYREYHQAIPTLWLGKDYANKMLINESGMYSLVLGSELPSAKKFQDWVTSEVLPSIRKHGAYMTDATIEKVLDDPDMLIRLATEMKNKQSNNQKLN